MKCDAIAGILVSGLILQTVASDSPDLKLTGFAHLGSTCIVCLTWEPGGRCLTLHPGETVENITFKALDLKRGVALVDWGTNRLQLRLVHYASTPAPNSAIASIPQSGVSSSGAVPGGETVFASERQPVGGRVLAAPGGTGGRSRTWLSAGVRNAGRSADTTTLVPERNAGVPGRTARASGLSQTPTAAGIAGEPIGEQPGVENQFAINGSGGNRGLETAPSQAESMGLDSEVTDPDPLQPERERVWILNGHEAYLTWDLAHRPAQVN
jgi:hypothetical protein